MTSSNHLSPLSERDFSRKNQPLCILIKPANHQADISIDRWIANFYCSHLANPSYWSVDQRSPPLTSFELMMIVLTTWISQQQFVFVRSAKIKKKHLLQHQLRTYWSTKKSLSSEGALNFGIFSGPPANGSHFCAALDEWAKKTHK